MGETSKPLRHLKSLSWRVSRGVDHDEVNGRVLQSGSIGGGYLMMTAVSAAIAVLGLLLSSPAVVIGAMLLSPLMGPIILLGFSFWRVDWPSMRKALASLGAGFGLALAVSLALTVVSPLKEPTTEILARAHPNLFDLLVAAFSGIAGGYAVVRRRNEAVIGVAIATALMPPLAVVGFGLGTQAWPIVGGALLLFFTNLLTIAIAAGLMAALHGFRPRHDGAKRGWLSHVAVLLIFAALCVPLTLGLLTIARESQATAAARSQIKTIFGPSSRVASLAVRRAKPGVEVNALVATRRFMPRASAQMTKALKNRLGERVQVNLDQIVVADPTRVKREAAQGSSADPPAANLAADAAKSLRAAVPFADTTTSYDPATGSGIVLIGAASPLDLAAARALEQGLRQRAGGDATTVIPPVRPLPPIPIPPGGKTSKSAIGATDLQAWALARWRVADVEARICGETATRSRRTAMATLLAAALPAVHIQMARSAAGCPHGGAPSVILSPAGAEKGAAP